MGWLMSEIKMFFGCSEDSAQELKILIQEVRKMSEQLDALRQQMDSLVTEVAENIEINASAIEAINGLVVQQQNLSEQLADAIAGGDMAVIQEVADAIADQVQVMSDSADALAAAIPQSTPVEEDPEDPEVPVDPEIV